MRCERSYPEDFKDAFKRTPPNGKELDQLRARSSHPPIFVYGHLMLPTVLKYFANVPQTTKVDMVYATLPEYKLYHFSNNKEPGPPTIKRTLSSVDVVEGMLVFGLTTEQRRGVHEAENSCSGQTILTYVEVQVPQIDNIGIHNVRSQKSVDAGTFVWRSGEDGLWPMPTTFWPMEDFLNGQLYENIVRHQNKVQGEEDID
ncbi:hypothetical protein BJX76DRAFT_139503 [Aspergillus varians]